VSLSNAFKEISMVDVEEHASRSTYVQKQLSGNQ